MNTDNSWSRCTKEFVTGDKFLSSRDFDDSVIKMARVKRQLDFNDAFSSYKTVVATDIALANIEQIERTELVARWIAEGICTPPISEQNLSSPSSTAVDRPLENDEKLLSPSSTRKQDTESSTDILLSELERSPVIISHKKFVRRSIGSSRSEKVNKILPALTGSPIIGKQRFVRKRRRRLDSQGKQKLDESESSSPTTLCVIKSPILGKGVHSSRRKYPRIKRKRLQDQLEPENDSFLTPVLRSFDVKEKNCTAADISGTVSHTEIRRELFDLDCTVLSQDLFEDQQTNESPVDYIVNREKVGSYSLCQKQNCPPSIPQEENESCLSLVFGTTMRKKKDSCELREVREHSFGGVIQDTEESPPYRKCEKLITQCLEGSPLEKQDELLILDSHINPEKNKLITDTENIDYDTCSENGKDDLNIDVGRISFLEKSDSDKTISDIIEEPITQDYHELSISVATPKISEIISSKEPLSDDTNIKTTPPRTEESSLLPVELQLSGKKRKYRPKRGSLGDRLQKLVSGQLSSVRVWRHQVSEDSVFHWSLAPCVILSVVDVWTKFGKDLYQCIVLEDSNNLLNDCFIESSGNEKEGDSVERNLVVMTNPEFVGPVKLVPETVFKMYSPWKVLNRNSSQGNVILHILYFNIVSKPVKLKQGSHCTELQEIKCDNIFKNSRIIHEYDCPCLKNRKLDDSCSVKFVNQKINVMNIILGQ